jgi:hypothetical protein
MGTEIGSALIELGENYGQNTFIGIYAINSVEVRESLISLVEKFVHRCIRFLPSSG